MRVLIQEALHDNGHLHAVAAARSVDAPSRIQPEASWEAVAHKTEQVALSELAQQLLTRWPDRPERGGSVQVRSEDFPATMVWFWSVYPELRKGADKRRVSLPR